MTNTFCRLKYFDKTEARWTVILIGKIAFITLIAHL